MFKIVLTLKPVFIITKSLHSGFHLCVGPDEIVEAPEIIKFVNLLGHLYIDTVIFIISSQLYVI